MLYNHFRAKAAPLVNLVQTALPATLGVQVCKDLQDPWVNLVQRGGRASRDNLELLDGQAIRDQWGKLELQALQGHQACR